MHDSYLYSLQHTEDEAIVHTDEAIVSNVNTVQTASGEDLKRKIAPTGDWPAKKGKLEPTIDKNLRISRSAAIFIGQLAAGVIPK